MDYDEKVELLKQCYGMHDVDAAGPILDEMCEIIVKELSDEEFMHLYEYMISPLYPAIYATINSTLSKVVANVFEPTKEEKPTYGRD